MRSSRPIDSRAFYGEYHGHRIADLERVCDELPEQPDGGRRACLYLVGDSTLDNKYWIPERVASANGLERLVRPPTSVPDIAHWLNAELEERGLGDRFCAINGAVEESCLGDRSGGRLLAHDDVVRRKLRPDDVVVCSMGGNDVALKPSAMTILSMGALLLCPKWLISAGLAPGLGHFVNLFGRETRRYLEALTAETTPRAVAVCMLYYLDEAPGGSWAEGTLSALGYNRDPSKLQLLMRTVFERATRRVSLPGVERVVPVALYEALDGKRTEDYVQRVEPSAEGGRKMARRILDALDLGAARPSSSL